MDFIRPRVATPEDAEDIVQEVFYEFSEAVRLMQPIEQLTSWLYTVARNRITDLYRKKKATPFSFLTPDGSDDEMAEEISELLLGDDSSPETEYLRSLVWQQLGQALEELPKEQREVFELHELQGISFKEISKRTGESVNTLLSRKRYAVLHLRERLRDLYEEFITL
jgi:RNA polymerase sigma factor (sigma-70 family)